MVNISSWEDLANINTGLAGDYVLTADLDSNSVGYDTYVAGGWTPLGNSSTKFTGTFDGAGFTISDLYYYSTTVDYIGLFGYVNGATISNLGVLNVRIHGDDYVGGLIGYNNASNITNCYSTGNVLGEDDYVGGLIGVNTGTSSITSCYSTCSVFGNYHVGGLIGQIGSTSQIYNSYATGNVISDGMYCGGLVGYIGNGGDVYDSYATGNVISVSTRVGGLVGYMSSAYLTNCYSTGSASGSTNIGGLVGYNSGGSATNCFWDTETSGNATSAFGTSKTSTEMKAQATFTSWDFPNDWTITEGDTYPKLVGIVNPDFSNVNEIIIDDFAVVIGSSPVYYRVHFNLLSVPSLFDAISKIKVAGSFLSKPVMVKISGTFVEKIMKVRVGGTFQ